jgi:hypothetical protein
MIRVHAVVTGTRRLLELNKKKKLRAIIVGERVRNDEPPLFSSASLVVDDSLPKEDGHGVAMIFYSAGGNIVIMVKDGYDPKELMAAGERFLGETLRANRYQVWRAQLVKEAA